jgi:hypothetical protein
MVMSPAASWPASRCHTARKRQLFTREPGNDDKRLGSERDRMHAAPRQRTTTPSANLARGKELAEQQRTHRLSAAPSRPTKPRSNEPLAVLCTFPDRCLMCVVQSVINLLASEEPMRVWRSYRSMRTVSVRPDIRSNDRRLACCRAVDSSYPAFSPDSGWRTRE